MMVSGLPQGVMRVGTVESDPTNIGKPAGAYTGRCLGKQQLSKTPLKSSDEPVE
jgi:hypothetical protein